MKTGVILARFQPIHNGHLQLIKKACDENEQVLVIIGSIDKLSKRNPIPWTIRKQLVEKAIKDHSLHEKTKIVELADLSDESDNSHDWGFYLYSFIVSKINQSDFTIYYSDGFETITSWFPGFLLRNNVSLSLLARNTCEDGVSATMVRDMILADSLPENNVVPQCVYDMRIENHKETEKGYRVKYEDGYESWSPAKAFEKSYKCADTFLDRLHIEMKDLYDRLDKLVAFIDSGKMDEVVTDNYQKFLLRLQQVGMGNYVKTLECRIGCLDGAPNAPFNQMSFGVAIEALKFGLAIRRKGWNGKGLWVIKQVPAHIESDIVPKMQSLPQSAKDLILKGKGFINYTSQCLIYNENTGRADSWIPSISDVFAEDWEIVQQ